MKLIKVSASLGSIILLSAAALAQTITCTNRTLPVAGAQDVYPVLARTAQFCNDACKDNAQKAVNFEVGAHAHTPLDDFYSVPASFNPSMAPGKVLKVEKHTNLAPYTVAGGLTMSRFMYTSETINGTIVPVSAYVLWPYKGFEYKTKCNGIDTPLNKTGGPKFPMVSFAHGTAGQFSNCAPSNYRALQYHFMTSYELAQHGFAVVATDYQGLGVDGGKPHSWLNGPEAANDIGYAVEAARAAFPDNFEPDGPFFNMGHSQGGNSAWAYAERQVQKPIPGYCGSTIVSPPTRGIDWVESGLKYLATAPQGQPMPFWTQIVYFLQPKFITTIATTYPEYNASGLTDVSYDRTYNVIKPLNLCLASESLLFGDIPPQQYAKANWTQDPIVKEWQKRTAPGGKPMAGPVLVLSADNDNIPWQMVEDDVRMTCANPANANLSLEFSIYNGTEHFSILYAAQPQYLAWFQERVINSTSSRPGGVCGLHTPYAGFQSEYASHSGSPLLYISWASLSDSWKFAL